MLNQTTNQTFESSSMHEMFRLLVHYRRLFLSLVTAFSFVCGALAQTTVNVYLNSNELFRGELLSMGSDYIMLRQENGVMRLNRDEIKYLNTSKTVRFFEEKDLRISLRPIDKPWTMEVQSGLTVISPLSLRADLHLWRSVSPRVALGFGPTLHFYRFSSMNATGRFRYATRPEKFIRPFFEAGGSISFYESVTGMNFVGSFWGTSIPPGYQASFSRIKQIEFGPGLYMDTGLGVAFTGKLLFNATWFNLVETPRTNFVIEGDYSVYTISVLSGFIF